MTVKELILFTPEIRKLKAFYNDTLHFPISEDEEDTFSMQWGYTKVIFRQRANATPYHLAIHIPSNQVFPSLVWLKSKVKVLTLEGEEVVDFKSWHAKSIYFYDTDHNILEFIAHDNLHIIRSGVFSDNMLVGVSEVGMPVVHIETTYDTIKRIVPLEIFDGGFDEFCAIGDAQGMFIVIDKHKKDWYPHGDQAHSSDFFIRIEHQGRAFRIQFCEGIVGIWS